MFPTINSTHSDLEAKMDSPTGKVVDSEAVYEIDKAAEARLVRKLDLRLLPLLAFAYMLCYFDVSPSPPRPPYQLFAYFGSPSPSAAIQRWKRACRWSHH